MAIKDALLPEFDQEMAVTRKMLERTPLADIDWKPHERSMDLGNLVGHVAELPGWTLLICGAPSYTFGPRAPRPRYASTAELLGVFDNNVSAARAAIDGTTDPEMMSEWMVRRGETVLIRIPKIAALRRLMMNHLIHHRGQFSVYLRLRGIPLPPVYGPTADESAI